MFKSQTGLFSKIPCPSVEANSRCEMLNCVFLHPGEERIEKVNEDARDEKLRAAITSLKHENESQQTVQETPKTTAVRSKADIKRSAPVQQTEKGHKRPKTESGLKSSLTALRATEVSKADGASASKSPVKTTSQLTFYEFEDPTKDILLVPRPVIPNAPAQTNTRMRYLGLLQHLYADSGAEFPNRAAVSKEYEIALRSTNRTYDVIAKREIYSMASMDPKSISQANAEDNEGERETQILNSLVHSKRILAQNAYITEIPRIPKDLGQVITTKCDRCAADFDITRILKRTKCVYHPERFSISKKTLRSHLSNDINSKFYPCCGAPAGENEGCVTSKYHVYKFNDPKRLQQAIPFKSTSEFATTPETLKAIALDCEMGYTTTGFELIRATMVDFFTEKVVYDKIIKPEGTVVDLNTRWSGVSAIDMNTSPSFTDFVEDISRLIDKDTILIGHSLENDLNVMRLVHHRVIDTSIMFTNGLKKRSLKDITFEFLSKKIQGGEHDSEEDAKSCIGIVKWEISKILKR